MKKTWQNIYFALEDFKKIISDASRKRGDTENGNIFTFDHYDSFLNMTFICPHTQAQRREGRLEPNAVVLKDGFWDSYIGDPKKQITMREMIEAYLRDNGFDGMCVAILNNHSTAKKQKPIRSDEEIKQLEIDEEIKQLEAIAGKQ